MTELEAKFTCQEASNLTRCHPQFQTRTHREAGAIAKVEVSQEVEDHPQPMP